MTIAAFMAEALLHPQYGYYRTADPFGRDGDFITSPDISQIFGELIGLWVVEMWQALGSPADAALVELGPGRGTLMTDALRAAKVVPEFLEAISVHLVETNPVLRKAQKAQLSDYSPTWHDSVGTLPDIPNLIIANEFFDALPIHQFRYTDAGWREVLVGIGKEGLDLIISSRETPHIALIDDVITCNAKIGDITEICPAAISLFEILASGITKNSGAALVIDYGSEFKEPKATLQGLHRHKATNFLDSPGEVDISAHLDFSALKRAVPPGVSCWGPVAQREFLLSMGIEIRASRLTKLATEKEKAKIHSACNRLIGPSEMGTLFKVLAVTSGEEVPSSVPPGFVK